MKCIHKYILKEIFIPTLLGLFFFTFVILINKLFRMIEFLLNKNIGIGTIIDLLSCLTPFFISFTIPMGVLVGVLIAFGRLSSENEILAIKTSGISILNLYIPTIIASTLLAALMIWMNIEIKPNLLTRASDIIYKMQFKVLTSIEPRKFYGDLTGDDVDLTLYCADKDEKTNELKSINIKVSTSLSQIQKAAEDKEIIKKKAAQQPDKKTKEEKYKKKLKDEEKEILLIASSGKIESDLKDKEIRLILTNGSLHLLSRSEDIQNNMVFFDEILKVLKPKVGRVRGGGYLNTTKQLTTPQLVEEYKKQSSNKKAARKLRREYHERISFPLACITFALIGMPLGIMIRPSGKSYGFAISFALLFVYYIFQNWGSVSMEQGKSYAVIAMYSPNIIISLVGIILIFISLRK